MHIDFVMCKKKRNKDYDFPPPLYVGGKQQINNYTLLVIHYKAHQ